MKTRLAIIAILVTPLTAAAGEPIRLPGGSKLKRVDFERHVAGLLGQLGCNAGACHGSFQGKGGFRLSLFGYSPALDYRSITRGGHGRRVNVSRPDASLLLKKPTMQIAHEGGRRLKKRSWQYQVIAKWIADGAKRTAGSGQVKRLRIQPDNLSLTTGQSKRLAVIATFADGTSEDVTPFCSIRVQNDRVAVVDSSGTVKAGVPGDTAIIADYIGNFATTRVLVPVSNSDRIAWPDLKSTGLIDDEVFAKLRTLGITPSQRCSDTDFLRRAMIDTVGRIPTPNEVRSFAKDRRPDKRRRLIDRLLADPMHAALWATRFSDLTGNDVDILPGEPAMHPKYAKMWHDWFRCRIAANRPYDEIVRGVLTATSRGKTPLSKWIERRGDLIRTARKKFTNGYGSEPYLDLFWRRPADKSAEITAAAFLGVRIECAQCHKHPFDRWTQTDYRSFVNVFAKVRFGSSPELRAAIVDRLDQRRKLRAAGKKVPPPLPRMQEVFLETDVTWQKHPETGQPLKPKAPGGPQFSAQGDPRKDLFRWLTSRNNPFFARNFVNRVWAHYFGRGLVHPVDDFSVVNPASNEKLLDRLAKDFVKSGFDIRKLERSILNSSTYQLAAKPNRTNRFDRTNYSRSYVRALPAEVAVDSLQSALGVKFNFGNEVPKHARAIEIAPNRVRNGTFARLFTTFERPARKTVCDCERRGDPSIRQSLFLMTDPLVTNGLKNGRLKRLLLPAKSNKAVIEELFLATVSRYPTKTERRTILRHLRKHKDRDKAFQNIFWALLNTREFLTNH